MATEHEAEGSSRPLIELRGVEKTFRMGEVEVHAIRGIDLDIPAGEFIALAGPSGSGKTTLMNLIGALDRVTAGQIIFDGADVTRASEGELTRLRRHDVGFIFQFYNLVPSLSALENVEIAARLIMRKEARERSRRQLEEVGMEDKMNKFPGQLSGGEQQRVAIARALVKEPRLVLADEPTGNVDSEMAKRIIKTMKTLNEKHGVTFVIATHNPALTNVTDRVVFLRDGKVYGETHPKPEDAQAFWEA